MSLQLAAAYNGTHYFVEIELQINSTLQMMMQIQDTTSRNNGEAEKDRRLKFVS